MELLKRHKFSKRIMNMSFEFGINFGQIYNNFITSHLELHTITEMSDMEGAEFIHHDRLDESFDPLVKIPSRSVCVLPNEFMSCGAG